MSAPGTEFHYFNPNYAVLARLVEVVAEQPFDEYLQEQIFTPLQMGETTTAARTAGAEEVAPDLAQGHVLPYGRPIAYDLPDGFVGGSGGVISTAADMAHFLIMQTGDGRFGSRSLVSAEAVAAMHTPPEEVDSDYAMGWTVSDQNDPPEQLGHTGVLSNFYSEQVLLPGTSHGIVLLANSYSALANFAGITQGLVALATGERFDSGWMSTRVLVVVLVVLTAGVLMLRLRSFRRRARWARRHHDVTWWRLIPGMVWLLLPVAILAGLPALTTRFAGRSFSYLQLFLALPEVVIWLGCAALTGVVVLVGRITALVRSPDRRGGWD